MQIGEPADTASPEYEVGACDKFLDSEERVEGMHQVLVFFTLWP